MFVTALETMAFDWPYGSDTYKNFMAMANVSAGRQADARKKNAVKAPPPATPSFPTPWLDNPDWVPYEGYFEETGYGHGPSPAFWAYVEHLAHKEDKERAQKRARTTEGSL
jgi:hypothetical protein